MCGSVPVYTKDPRERSVTHIATYVTFRGGGAGVRRVTCNKIGARGSKGRVSHVYIVTHCLSGVSELDRLLILQARQGTETSITN